MKQSKSRPDLSIMKLSVAITSSAAGGASHPSEKASTVRFTKFLNHCTEWAIIDLITSQILRPTFTTTTLHNFPTSKGVIFLHRTSP